MTKKKLKDILDEIPYNELVLDGGIYEFYTEDSLSMGISYEAFEEDPSIRIYIFNIFVGDEYINISGSEPVITDETINNLVRAWNKYVDSENKCNERSKK